MQDELSISISICTRNRHEDLHSCIVSICAQTGVAEDNIEILIVDDGDTSPEWISAIQQLLPNRMELNYIRKERSEAGLLKSRIKSAELCKHELLLFLDDDVELYPDYLLMLKRTLSEHPEAVGVGGVDQGFICTTKGKLMMLLSGQGTFSPGKLSWGGFASSMNFWNKQKNTFATEFLHGCNMCFKVTALDKLKTVEWLNGYSLGEDLYISYLAARKGPLYVNPTMKLLHHGSPVSRDKEQIVSYTKIINHYHLLELRENAARIRYYMLLWTGGFLYINKRLQKNEAASTGYLQGIRELWQLLKNGTPSIPKKLLHKRISQ